MRTYHAGDGPVRELTFTADGKTLVCSRAGAMHLNEAVYWISKVSGEHTRVLDLVAAMRRWKAWDEGPFEDAQIGDVWFTPDGEWVAVQQYLGDPILLWLWGARSRRWSHIAPASEYDFCIDAATFSPDSQVLVFATGTDGGGTHWLERRTVRTRRRLPPIAFPGYTVSSLAFSPDERRLAAATLLGVYVYEHDRGPVRADVPELTVNEELGPICFRPDGKELAILYGEEVLFWDGLASEAEHVTPGPSAPGSLAWSPDGRFLVLGCADGTVRFWDRAAGRQAQSYDWGIGPVGCVAFAPDGMTCAAGGAKGAVLWDVAE